MTRRESEYFVKRVCEEYVVESSVGGEKPWLKRKESEREREMSKQMMGGTKRSGECRVGHGPEQTH